MPSCLCPLGSRCPCPAPANHGTGIFSDKSLEIFKDVSAFAQKYNREGGDGIFVTRMALKPTFVLTSNKAVESFLEDTDPTHFYNGMKDFFFGLFGHSVLFADAAEAAKLRTVLLPLFDSSSLLNYESTLQGSLNHWANGLCEDANPVPYYAFKRLSLAYNLRAFLGVDEESDPELFATLCGLTTAHWHGIISVPLNIKLSFFASSSYRKAQEAKQKLLDVIDERLNRDDVPFVNRFKELSDGDQDTLRNHMLVFVCALIPKAAASVLASAVDTSQLWRDKMVNSETGEASEEDLTTVLLECLRMWPPFVGGFRVAQSQAEVGVYHVPKGYGVFYVASQAHRDPLVFPDPDQFLPQRWTTINKDDRDKLFGFGSGIHRCVGEQFAFNFLLQALKTFVRGFKWDCSGLDGTAKIKYLPVSRPAELEPLELHKRCKTSQ